MSWIRLMWMILFLPALLLAADRRPGEPRKQVEADWVDDRFAKMDTGPFFSGSIALPGGGRVNKGIVVKLDGGNAAAVFDTELLAWCAGWTGGFVEINPARFGLIGSPKPAGKIVFQNPPRPGWAGPDGSFGDPRPAPHGPLPQAWGRYAGLYLHGEKVVLSYQVAGTRIDESPSFQVIDGRHCFVRDLRIAPHERPLALHATGERLIPATPQVSYLQIVAPLDATGDIELKPGSPVVESWLSPADGRWGEPLITRGVVGERGEALAIDTITMPYENPWNALMFAGGHDFFSNGDAAVCTIHGDVWIVSGIDEDLDEIRWKRFATGLYQPLGLKIIDDKLYVTGRDQITLLHDRNGDGEADFYENFNNEGHVSGGGHEYVTCLETDSAGNFYMLKCAGPIAHGGTLLRVPADGRGIEVVATGFRNPNGLGLGPGDVLTVGDQQGEWVPATRIDLVTPGGFYGYMPMHHRDSPPATYDGPLCWVPREVDNSAGGQVWIPQGQWGPLGGQLLHFSYGRGTMMLVLRDEVEGVWQGATVPLPGRFLSGAMRGRFNPHDGHLYVTGSNGWQTAAVRDGCFQRVRYTGGPLNLPVSLNVHEDGLRLTFSDPLDRSTAQDIGSYALARWNYRWTEKYGSADWSVTDPQTRRRDEMRVTGARLADDDRTLFLRVQDMGPVMQMELRYDLDSADGRPLRGGVYPTVHRLRPAKP
jgi:hypothetical protein